MSSWIEDYAALLESTPTKEALRNKAEQLYDKFVEAAAESVTYGPEDEESIGVSADEHFGEEFSYIKDTLKCFEDPRPDQFYSIAKSISDNSVAGKTIGQIQTDQSIAVFNYLNEWDSEAITGLNEGYITFIPKIIENDRELIDGLIAVTCSVGSIYANQRVDAMSIADATIKDLESLIKNSVAEPDNAILLKLGAAITAIVASAPSGIGLVAASLGAVVSLGPSSGVCLVSKGGKSVYEIAASYASSISDLEADVSSAEESIAEQMDVDVEFISSNQKEFVGKVIEVGSPDYDSVDNAITPG